MADADRTALPSPRKFSNKQQPWGIAPQELLIISTAHKAIGFPLLIYFLPFSFFFFTPLSAFLPISSFPFFLLSFSVSLLCWVLDKQKEGRKEGRVPSGESRSPSEGPESQQCSATSEKPQLAIWCGNLDSADTF